MTWPLCPITGATVGIHEDYDAIPMLLLFTPPNSYKTTTLVSLSRRSKRGRNAYQKQDVDNGKDLQT